MAVVVGLRRGEELRTKAASLLLGAGTVGAGCCCNWLGAAGCVVGGRKRKGLGASGTDNGRRFLGRPVAARRGRGRSGAGTTVLSEIITLRLKRELKLTSF